jgi:hypothetical protein
LANPDLDVIITPTLAASMNAVPVAGEAHIVWPIADSSALDDFNDLHESYAGLLSHFIYRIRCHGLEVCCGSALKTVIYVARRRVAN